MCNTKLHEAGLSLLNGVNAAGVRKSDNESVSHLVYVSTFVALTSGLLCYLSLQPGVMFANFMLHDCFHYIAAAYRLAHGQFPHLDFQTPLGFLTYKIPAWALNVADVYAMTMPVALVMCCAGLTPVIAYVLGTRFHFWVAAPVALYLLLLILIVAVNVGEQPVSPWR